jgi:hypothetical protein
LQLLEREINDRLITKKEVNNTSRDWFFGLHGTTFVDGRRVANDTTKAQEA